MPSGCERMPAPPRSPASASAPAGGSRYSSSRSASSRVSDRWTTPSSIVVTSSAGTYRGRPSADRATASPSKMSWVSSPVTSSTRPISCPSADTTFQPLRIRNQETGSPTIRKYRNARLRRHSHLPLDRVAKVGANRGKEVVRLDGDFQYGQWRYQLVGACPRDLNGNRLASVGDSRGERCESASTKFQLVTGSRAAQCGPRSFSRTIAARSAGGRAPELLVERDER